MPCAWTRWGGGALAPAEIPGQVRQPLILHAQRRQFAEMILPVGQAAFGIVARLVTEQGPGKRVNWLRVLGTAELPQIDQGVRQQFHAKMSLLHVFKPQQQPLEFVLPRKGPIDTRPQGMNSFIEEPLASSLGPLAVAWVLFDVRNHAGIEDHLPVVRGIEPSIEVKIRTCQHHTRHFCYALQRVQTIRQ
jgi:hypothetical protein